MRRPPARWPALVSAGFLSRAAALVYHVLWTRQLTLVLRHTVAAVSPLLATFMAGPARGSALAARRVERVSAATRPRAYAAVELGIAGSALALPWLLPAGLPILAALARSGIDSPLARESVRLALSAVLLLVPTVLMGV